MNDNQAFNSVISHMQKIEGAPNKPADLNTMPAPLRWFAYIAFGSMAIGGITVIIIAILT